MPEENASPPAVAPSASPLDDPSSDRFKALLRDPRMFIREHDPFTAAVWTALLKPTSEVMNSFRRRAIAQPPPSDEPGEEQSPDDPMAILSMGEALVATAIMGSSKALAQIAERIEGKVGFRKGDVDPESQARQREMHSAMVDVVRAYVDARRSKDAVVIDAKPVDGTG